MGFSLDINIPAVTVFLQGLISFFSPCVLPLLPLYIGYLSGGTRRVDEDGTVHYDRKKVIWHTLFFVLGISFTFVILGLGVSAMGQFFKGNQLMFARIGGILVTVIGLYQLGIFGNISFFATEKRLSLPLNPAAMSPLTAFLLGFTFSFAWTPCVGPALAGVLLMAASAATKTAGFVLIGVYTAGFVIPFLAVGLFATTLLAFFKKNGRIVQYTVKAGAVLMIFMGVLMFTGKMNTVTGYLSSISLPADGKKAPDTEQGSGAAASGNEAEETASVQEEGGAGAEDNSDGQSAGEETASGRESIDETDAQVLPAIDFTLKDQYGEWHTFSDYKGKTVFLNFWATWCPPCRNEMPEIQKIYEEYQEAGDDSVVILGVAAPDFGQEQSEEDVIRFLEKNGYTYPVVMDTTGDLFMGYGVFSYPTTFMIDKDGNVFGYATGQLSESMMRSIIEQTVTGKRK